MWAGSFLTSGEAKASALDVVAYLSALDRSEWPLFGERFIRPEEIVSVEVISDRARATIQTTSMYEPGPPLAAGALT